MSRRTTSEAPAARGRLLAACSAALAVAAHGTAGGKLSDSALTLLLSAVLAWGGAALARRGGLLTVIAALGTTQLAQHVLLTEVATHGHATPPFNGWVMLAAHAVATVLTALLLLRADAALAAIRAAVAWLVGRLQALCPAPPAGDAAGTAATSVPVRPGELLEVLLRQVSPRRGPPVHS